MLTGCTFGKGNLIFNDFGKYVYTFMNRESQKAIRISIKKESGEMMNIPEDDLLTIEEVNPTPVPMAPLHESVDCVRCGESAMETRIRLLNGEPHCIPCFEELTT
jgi:formylmethanofuran dehydrogenase subunit E